jgi:PAS domain S-box-containing protein
MANPRDPTLIGADLSGELFASIVEHSFDAIVSKDLQGIVRTWNRGAETLLGWSSAEIVGKSIRAIIPADRLGEEDAVLKRIIAGEVVPKFETTRQHKSGKPVPLAITVSPLRNSTGRIIGASKIAHDISETLHIRSKRARNSFVSWPTAFPNLRGWRTPTGRSSGTMTVGTNTLAPLSTRCRAGDGPLSTIPITSGG